MTSFLLVPRWRMAAFKETSRAVFLGGSSLPMDRRPTLPSLQLSHTSHAGSLKLEDDPPGWGKTP